MSIILDVVLENAKIISGNRLYLELLLDITDRDNLCELVKKNFKDDYIKSLYLLNPDEVTVNYCEYSINKKINSNNLHTKESKQFEELHYVVKIKSGEIIGKISIYGEQDHIEISLLIDYQHAHQRYGTEAVQTIIEFLRKHSVTRELKWDCDANNLGSVGVALNCNFVHQKDYTLCNGTTSKIFTLSL